MRLTLRKKLAPYTSFAQLADDLNVTVPELKKTLCTLEKEGRLGLGPLFSSASATTEIEADGLFRLFHESGRCLVCGHPMTRPERRDIGWGEFKQCSVCQFSAHELANYETRKKAAQDQLMELLTQFQKTEKILRNRVEHRHALSGFRLASPSPPKSTVYDKASPGGSAVETKSRR